MNTSTKNTPRAKRIKISSAEKAVYKIDLSAVSKKDHRILDKISASSMIFGQHDHVSDFMVNAKRYIQAARESRLIITVHSIAPSGMSRKVSLYSLEKQKGEKRHWVCSFNHFARLTGKTIDGNSNIVLQGCGTDLLWELNYDIINGLQRLGFISKKEAEVLAQRKPHTC